MMQGMGIYIWRDVDSSSRIAYLGEFYEGKFHGIGKLARMTD